MSREQRRSERRRDQTGGSGAAGAPPSRRTPVKVAGGGGFPTIPLAVGGGVLLVVLLLAYLIFQSNSGGSTLSASQKAAQDRSTSLPGTYVEDQGRGHLSGNLAGHQMTPFCDGVPQSDSAKLNLNLADSGASPSGSATSSPIPTSSPNADATSGTSTSGTPTVPTNCYNSNPPSSGKHLNVQRNVDVGGGKVINIPSDPDVYPPEVEIPRDSIPHILEHAGVFAGYNCKQGDNDCQAVAQQLTDLVNGRIDNHDNRVVLAHDNDLPEGTIGLSSWTRVLNFPYTEWDQQKDKVSKFISTHACRFDPENFCR